jgi:FtsH-binding integral membrane protein
MNALNRIYEKRKFLSYVFMNLFFQLCITYYVMNRKTNPDINILYLFIAQITIILILAYVKLPEIVKLLLFTLFSYLFGLTFYDLKEKYNYNKEVINVAISGAASVFLSMMIVGVVLIAGGIKLGYKFGLLLYVSLIALIIARLIFFISRNKDERTVEMSDRHKLYSTIGILIFAGYVLYNTNRILQKNYKEHYITASLDYYLDFINLFADSLYLAGNEDL